MIKVSYRRRGGPHTNLSTIIFKVNCPKGVAISIKKYNDLLELTKYLVAAKRKYYELLRRSAKIDAAEAKRAIKTAAKKNRKRQPV